MALLERLQGSDGYIKIPTHQFWAAMKEIHLGELTVAQVKSYFNMDASDQTDFDWLISKYQASSNKPDFIELMHSIFMLAEVNSPNYITTTDLTSRINRIA